MRETAVVAVYYRPEFQQLQLQHGFSSCVMQSQVDVIKMQCAYARP